MNNTLLYDLLGIEADATTADVKAAYRLAVKTHHPDRGGNARHFVAITQAYHVLSNPQKRLRYDATGQFDADEADNSHAELIVTLSGALDIVLSASRSPIESTDIVAEMRRLLAESRAIVTGELEAIDRRLASLRSARTRIKRKDEAQNLFVDVIDGQIRRLVRSQAAKREVLDLQERALEELEGYDSMVEVIRTVQSGLGAPGERHDGRIVDMQQD